MDDKPNDKMLGMVEFGKLCPKYSLTVEDVVLALYDYATQQHWADNHVLEELESIRQRQHNALNVSGCHQTYLISEIGDVYFNCLVTPDSMDLHSYELKYGSVKTLIQTLQEKRKRDQIALEIQDGRQT